MNGFDILSIWLTHPLKQAAVPISKHRTSSDRRRLHVDDENRRKIYGKWKFDVIGGKPKQVGRSDRATADSMTFVEGGKDAFWFKRESVPVFGV